MAAHSFHRSVWPCLGIPKLLMCTFCNGGPGSHQVVIQEKMKNCHLSTRKLNTVLARNKRKTEKGPASWGIRCGWACICEMTWVHVSLCAQVRAEIRCDCWRSWQSWCIWVNKNVLAKYEIHFAETKSFSRITKMGWRVEEGTEGRAKGLLQVLGTVGT